MAWKLSGRSVELCNCEMMCPCWLGPEKEPDKGWCAGALAWDIQAGESNGVDLGGTKVAFRADWPNNFFAGEATARLYIDGAASSDQRRELDAIFSGKAGGHLEGLWGAVIEDWLPTQDTSIEIEWGETPTIKVGSVADLTMHPLQDANGKRTTVQGAAAMAAFGVESMDLASSAGNTRSDPDLRPLEGDSGTLHEFNWSS